MPDLSKCKCKCVDGKLYCWDRESQWPVEISITPLCFTPAAKKIVAAFVEDDTEKDKEA